MCGVAQYHVMEGNLKIIVVFKQPEESPFFLAEPRTSTERLMSSRSSSSPSESFSSASSLELGAGILPDGVITARELPLAKSAFVSI